MKNGWLMKAMPWLLNIGGFSFLSKITWYFPLGCMLVGIVMLIERKWPERWACDYK